MKPRGLVRLFGTNSYTSLYFRGVLTRLAYLKKKRFKIRKYARTISMFGILKNKPRTKNCKRQEPFIITSEPIIRRYGPVFQNPPVLPTRNFRRSLEIDTRITRWHFITLCRFPKDMSFWVAPTCSLFRLCRVTSSSMYVEKDSGVPQSTPLGPTVALFLTDSWCTWAFFLFMYFYF